MSVLSTQAATPPTAQLDISREQIREAIRVCIRRACDRPNDEWYAVTVHPDGHIEHRCGIGTMTYSADEYFGATEEETVYVCDGYSPSTWVEWQGDETNDEREDVLDCELSDFMEQEIEDYERCAEEAARAAKMQAEWEQSGSDTYLGIVD
jgi:hypothetical protein